MPLGDSVTRGTNDINYPNGSIPGGYRKELGYRLAAGGFAFDFVGSNSDNAYPGMDPDHNGNNGFRTDQMLANLPAWLAVNPDIVLLHAGTNDILQNVPVATAVGYLKSLIDTTINNAPSRRLYVATIIPITQDWQGRTAAYLNGNANTYNSQLRSLVQQYASQGKRVYLVEMNGGIVINNANPALNFYQPGDGIHPGQAGYNQMAAIWYNSLSAEGSLFDPPPAGSPNAPTTLEVSLPSTSQADLTWNDNSLDETGFQIFQKTGENGAWQLIGTSASDTTSLSIGGLNTAGNPYFFAVRAINSSGSSAWSNVAPTVPKNLALHKPASASSIYSSSYQASYANNDNPSTLWSAASNDTAATWNVDLNGNFRIEQIQITARQDVDQPDARKNFEVRASGDATFANYSVIASQGSNPLPHAATMTAEVTVTTPFRYVKVVKTDGSIFSLGEVRVFGSVPPPPSEAPSDLTIASSGSAEISLTWTDNSAAESGFKLERKAGAGGTYSEITSLPANTTQYTDTGLSHGTYYIYRIRSTNGVEDSAYSPEASATTSSLTDYDTWAADYPDFLALPPSRRSPEADANDDGTSNLLAYAMALDPLAAIPEGVLPQLLMEEGLPVFRYRRSKTADVDFDVLISQGLSSESWLLQQQSDATVTAFPGDPDAEWVKVPLSPGSSGFARLRVTRH